MPLKEYGILKCTVKRTDPAPGREDATPHYHVFVQANGQEYRLSINSKNGETCSGVMYYVNPNFQHEITDQLLESDLPFGYTALERAPGGLALDYIRRNICERRQFLALPTDQPGPENDLNDLFDMYLKKAIDQQNTILYVFGEPYPNGMHDIHMNQGSIDKYADADGVYQDGGLLLHIAPENRWVAIFLAFRTQSWHTDDTTGHALTPQDCDVQEVFEGGRSGAIPRERAEEHPVLIAGACVNPGNRNGGQETVTLLNVSDRAISLDGWSLLNRADESYSLTGTIEPGEFKTYTIEHHMFRENGDTITLVNDKGLKVDGEAYTKQHVKQAGWTIHF